MQLWEKTCIFLIHSRIHTQNNGKLTWFSISMPGGFSKHLLHLHSLKTQRHITNWFKSQVCFYNSICCWWPVFSFSSFVYTSLCLKFFPALLLLPFPLSFFNYFSFLALYLLAFAMSSYLSKFRKHRKTQKTLQGICLHYNQDQQLLVSPE